MQGILLNPNQDNNYTFRFTPAALAKTSVFYADRLFLVPYLGLLLPAAACVSRNRRTWFGLTTMLLFFLPLLFLPGRLHGAYCYVPFTGMAVAFSGIADSARPAVIVAFLLLWAPLDYMALRAQRRATLAVDNEVREWVTTIAGFAKTVPLFDAVVYSGTPAGVDSYGAVGALRYLFHRSDFVIHNADVAEPSKLQHHDRIVLLNWDRQQRKLSIVLRAPDAVDAAYIEINAATPIWQLGEGWYGREGTYRWIAPEAVAQLNRPEGARRFELRVNVGPELLQRVGPSTVRISFNDLDLGPRRFDEPGWQEAQWDLPPAPAGTVRVSFHVSPGYRPPDSPPLGIAVGAFGFKP
jgi:hypothetical protein